MNYTEKLKSMSGNVNALQGKLVLVLLVVAFMFLFAPRQLTRNIDQIQQIEVSYKNCPLSADNNSFSKKPLMTNLNKGLIDLYEDTTTSGFEYGEIPAIIEPKFIDLESAKNCIKKDETVFLLFVEDKVRIYPKSILNVHQIVNDNINDQKIIITYSPTSDSVMAYETNGEIFEPSGRLYADNTLMIDNRTNSLWLQLVGEAVIGDNTGYSLKPIGMTQTSFGEISDLGIESLLDYRKIQVLSFETGYSFNYISSNEAGIGSGKKTIYFDQEEWVENTDNLDSISTKGNIDSIEQILMLLSKN